MGGGGGPRVCSNGNVHKTHLAPQFTGSELGGENGGGSIGKIHLILTQSRGWMLHVQGALRAQTLQISQAAADRPAAAPSAEHVVRV